MSANPNLTAVCDEGTIENLKNLDADALVIALFGEVDGPHALIEASRRIKSNVATKLATRYLLGSREARNDAFDGLVGLCWDAKGNVSVHPTRSEKAEGKSTYDCTREFIQDFVLEHFRAYGDWDMMEIIRAALEDEFRYIGRRARSRMIDEVRRRMAKKNREPGRRGLEHSDCMSSEGIPGIESILCGSPHAKAATYREFLSPRQERLTRTLGQTGYEVLLSHIDVYPAAFAGTDQSMESMLTRAIQKRRMVSAQQARADKRNFRETVTIKVKEGSPDLLDLHAHLSTGDDDNTLKIEWIGGGGRKGSFRMRFPLSF